MTELKKVYIKTDNPKREGYAYYDESRRLYYTSYYTEEILNYLGAEIEEVEE